MAGKSGRQAYRGTTEVNEADLTIVYGSWAADGSGGADGVRGKNFTVTDGGTLGVVDVTFTEKYPMLVSMVCTVGQAVPETAQDLTAEVGSYSATTGIIAVTTCTLANVEADPADGVRIHFVAAFHKRNLLSKTYET
jgi:hypothetical protein